MYKTSKAKVEFHTTDKLSERAVVKFAEKRGFAPKVVHADIVAILGMKALSYFTHSN